MKNPPGCATAVLRRFGPQDEPFIGDLVEEYAAGRSRAWYWRQVLSAVLLASVREIATHPWRAVRAVATGWTTLLLLFLLLGDTTANGLAGLLWDWDRQIAYATQNWWPFWITALVISYTGFVLSALIVVWSHRRYAGPMVVAYAASMLLVLSASAVIIEILNRRHGGIPVPHTLFYVISVALPHHWRSGLLLAPTVILAAGLLACPPSRPATMGAPWKA